MQFLMPRALGSGLTMSNRGSTIWIEQATLEIPVPAINQSLYHCAIRKLVNNQQFRKHTTCRVLKNIITVRSNKYQILNRFKGILCIVINNKYNKKYLHFPMNKKVSKFCNQINISFASQNNLERSI